MNYEKEVCEKYGETKEYSQCKNKTSEYTKEDYDRIIEESNEIMFEFVDRLKQDVNPENCTDLVIEWQNYITKYFYKCTNEILLHLADTYVEDERFKENLDCIYEGLAKYISDSIKAVIKLK